MDTFSPDEHGTRLRGLLAIVFLLFGILFLRLFQLQIATFADYERESEQNRIAPKRIRAPRGRILARDGQVLVRNRASYSILLQRRNRQQDSTTVAALHRALGGPPIKYHRKRRSILLKRDVDFRAVSLVEESLKDRWAALEIETGPQRNYPYGRLAGHILGYLGELEEEDLKTPRAKRYIVGDQIGKTGIEKTFEDSLRGEDGVRYIEVDARSRVIRHLDEREQPAQAGTDLSLTISLRLQQAAEQALPDSLPGSLVALDPRTGAILAMVSKPDFDPNVFVTYQDQAERKRLMGAATKPLLNRAVQGRYPPGSTAKMIVAMAAVELGLTDTLSTFAACVGSLQVGDVVFHCNNRSGHGEMSLLEAMETSCNVYFYHLAQNLGMDDWRAYAELVGFGQPTGLAFDPVEDPGLLPTKEYYAQKEGWTWGHLLNLAIGQGALLVTPLQMARYVAVLANGGQLVTPHLYGLAPKPKSLNISAGSLDIIKKSMRRVVHGQNGTGRKVYIEGLEIAGKSGTAQSPRLNNDAWFVAFAPYEKPTIALVVVIEGGGGGGSVAGPVARQVLKAHFNALDPLPPSGKAGT
jgi:penicillin-binding protein 2